ncbi:MULTISPECIES: gephyrin-like molybdotransferase receptor GlpR [unclassified Streptomyces]|uniref:divisome protein SepX/GlpR n=1 Tax=unclassified Streptomyces TaxID=2593676 RepID=UPI0034083293
MSSSGLIYAVIVGAWAAYLVPMWLRRQDELNEARPTERFSTAIRLLSGRAGMERRYAKDLRARSTEEGEHHADPDGVTDSVDVRAFAMPPTRREARADVDDVRDARDVRDVRGARDVRGEARSEGQAQAQPASKQAPRQASKHASEQAARQASRQVSATVPKPGSPAGAAHPASKSGRAADGRPVPRQGAKPSSNGASASSVSAASSPARRAAAADAAARARRSKVLARRRRTTVMLFMAFTLGAVVAAVGGLAFLWAPGVPAVMLSVYIAYLRSQERRRFTYVMDRRRAEVAAQRLRERQPRRRPPTDPGAADEPEDGPEADTDPGLSALAADRRALVEQTDHAEWVDQQRERRSGPSSGGDSWDPVPVPLPTYVTAPVAPRATSEVDLGGPDAWSSARSSTVEPNADCPTAEAGEELGESEADDTDYADDTGDASGSAADARRAASARRARERGRTPLFDQYEDGDRPRAANE